MSDSFTPAFPAASSYDAIIAGAGPAGLSAAAAIARAGNSVLVLERGHEIGSPIRTSGGTFVDEAEALGLPARLYHPISRVRFISRKTTVKYDFPQPRLCVLDVRATYQYLAERAIEAGASIELGTSAESPIIEAGVVTGVRTQTRSIASRLVLDATGYHSHLLKQAGLDPGFKRFGVGAEYDLYAPFCSESEAVLFVGGEVAPSGYAWVFPWGCNRVRVGVGIIHPDSRANPQDYLDRLMGNLRYYKVDLRRAQPIEHHQGLIPSECFAKQFAGNGILGIGDAAGHASSLLGEGIRWAMNAGRMAGAVAADALQKNDVSRASLARFESDWVSQYGTKLRFAHMVNERMAHWDDAKWDERLALFDLLTPDQFIEVLKTNITGNWLLRFAMRNPKVLAQAAGLFTGNLTKLKLLDRLKT